MKANLRFTIAALVASFGWFAVPQQVQAQGTGTCNAFIAIDYPNTPDFNTIGSIDTVQLTLTAGSIMNGNNVTVTQVAFNLDCRVSGCANNTAIDCCNNALVMSGGCTAPACPGGSCPCSDMNGCLSLGTSCLDDGAVAGFVDGSELTVSCTSGGNQVTFDGVAAGNVVTFTASPAVVIPANTAPGSECVFTFNVQKLALESNDATPLRIEQIASYMNAACDNGVSSSNAQSGFIGIDVTPTPSPSPTNTATQTPTDTATQTPTQSPSPSNTPTQTATNTPSQTPTPSNTPTQSPTRTPTFTATATPIPATATPTPPPIPVVSSPFAPAGLALIGLLTASLVVMVRRNGLGRRRG